MKELAFEVAETSRIMRRVYDRRAASLGITSTQWRVMLRLNREPGLKQVELADRLDVEPITACRIVDRMEEAGLVERLRDPEDRRAWRLRLTDKAEPILRKLKGMGEEMASEAFAGFAPDDIVALRTALERIRANVGRIEADQRESA